MATYQIETQSGVYEIETEATQPQEQSKDPRQGKFIPQMTKALYEGVPFGKRVIGMMPNAEQLKQTMESTPEPSNLMSDAGRLAGQIASAAPAMAGAEAVIPGKILAGALGFGAQRAGQVSSEGATPIQSLAEGAKETAIGYAGGKVIQKAAPAVGKEVGKFLSPLAQKAQAVLEKNAKVYRSVLNPGKGIIQAVETKSGKKIDDFMKLAADEELVIHSNEGKIDTKPAIAALKDRKVELNAQLESALESDRTKKFNLLEIADLAKQNLVKNIRNASDLKAAIKSVDDQIADEIARHGEKMTDSLGNVFTAPFVDGVTANKIKGGMWDKSYNILSPNENKVSRQIGFSIKDAIEKAYPDQAIKETNARLGDFVTLENILKKSDGNVIQRGKIGNYVGNIVGMGVGGALGSAVNPGLGTAVGSAGGAAIGGAASKFLANPERITRGLKSEVGAIGKAGSKLGELISSKIKTPIPVKKTPIPSKKATSTAPVKGQTPIKRLSDTLKSKKGEAVIGRDKSSAEKFLAENPEGTVEEYVASRMTHSSGLSVDTPVIKTSDGKIFDGKTHSEAFRKAVDDGEIIEKGDKYFNKYGKEIDINWDLFKLNNGELIDRITADRAFGFSAGETMLERKSQLTAEFNAAKANTNIKKSTPIRRKGK